MDKQLRSDFEKLLELLSKIPTSEFKTMRNYIRNEDLSNKNNLRNSEFIKNQNKSMLKDDNEKRELIGSLPYILTNLKYFPTNESIVSFAKKIEVSIPHWQKKQKSEILGRIIIEILKFEPEKIKQFNQAMRSLSIKADRGEVSDFFNEWDNVIKNVQF